MNNWLWGIVFCILLLIASFIYTILKEIRRLLGDRFSSLIADSIKTSAIYCKREWLNEQPRQLVSCQVTILGEYTYGDYTRPGVIGEYIDLQPGAEYTFKNSPDAEFTAKCWHLSAPLDCRVVAFTLANEHVILAPGAARFGLLNHKMTPGNRYTITVKRS